METACGGFILALLLAHGCLALARVRRGDAATANRFWLGALTVLLAFDYLNHFHVSPSPNLPAAAAIAVVAWLFLLRQPEMALGCAGCALSLKITLAPLLVASLGRHRRATALAAAAAAPVFLANWVTSGYPLFPSAFASFALPEWMVDPARVASRGWETIAWARYGGRLGPGSGYWSADWIAGWILRPVNFGAMLVSAIGLIWARGRLAVIGAVGLLAWLASAPDPRFGFGYVAILAGAAFSAAAPVRLPGPAILIGIVLLEAALRPAIVTKVSPHDPLVFGRRNLLLQPPIKKQESRKEQAAGFQYTEANGPACWDAEFPCTIEPLPEGLRLRHAGKGLAYGFLVERGAGE